MSGLLVLAGVLGACEASIGPVPDPGIVVQVILLGGQPTQFAWVEQAASPDSQVNSVMRPIDANALVLALLGDSGQAVLFAPTVNPAQFSVQRQVDGPSTYQIVGGYMGTPIHAKCLVPAPLRIQPEGSVHVASGDSVVIHWNAAAGASVYALSSHSFPSAAPSLTYAVFTSDTSYVLRGLPAGVSLTEVLYVMAIDSVSAAFFAAASSPAGRVRGNIEGALGACGGATVDSVLVVDGP